MTHFCTLFDKNFLARGILMITSLQQNCPHCQVFVLCLDDATFNYLNKHPLPNTTPILIQTLEEADSDLKACKANRNFKEYYFTISPCLPLYLLKKYKLPSICLLDADLYFYSPIDVLFKDYDKYSIWITEHQFTDELIARGSLSSGTYNVAFQVFKNNEQGLACLNKWRIQCLDWCYAFLDKENKRFGDQGYLDTWLDDFPGQVKVFKPLETQANVALWNINRFNVSYQGGQILVNDKPLVFYHFSNMQILSDSIIANNFWDYYVQNTPVITQNLYLPYINKVISKQKEIDITHKPKQSLSEWLKKRILIGTFFLRYNSNSARFISIMWLRKLNNLRKDTFKTA
jgi:hypothetical protein